MLSDVSFKVNESFYVSRLKSLLSSVKREYAKQGVGEIVLFANFERDSELFKQDSSFFYLTGIEEPGVVLVCDFDGKTTLYVPNCSQERAKWMDVKVPLTQENAKELGVDEVMPLGGPCKGYGISPFFSQDQYKHLLDRLQSMVVNGKKIFTLCPDNVHRYVEQRCVIERIKTFVPELASSIVDVSPIVEVMRRTKDSHEIERLYEAITLTAMAHDAAAQAIEPNVSEGEIQGALEYIFTATGNKPAFPSVVAGGKNGTVLHYSSNGSQLQDGDLVVIDIGARLGNYCADLTRTYPVSGKFTARQRELYEAVLETQRLVAQTARPGMYLINKENPDKSLHHLAKKVLASKGLEKYFTHGIGHFLGLDVHDVGDLSRPLQVGDVFTIEPGIYIPEENIGIRIEDDFWMVKDGVVCLSEDLPRDLDAIEKMMHEGLEPSEDVSVDSDETVEH